jgi:hypothetical protein
MWFKLISLVISFVCIFKAIIGLLFHKKFYVWDRKQYASKSLPLSLLIFIPYGVGIVVTTWYATIFHYVDYGWIVTLIVSIASVKLFAILFKWKISSSAFVRFIDQGGWRLWAVDIFVLLLGIIFLLLALFVYS